MGSQYSQELNIQDSAIPASIENLGRTFPHTNDDVSFDAIFDWCIDGYTCLWLLRKYLETDNGDNISGHAFPRPASQERLYNIVTGKKGCRGIGIFDYSFPLPVLLTFSDYDWIVVVDHHERENKELLNADPSKLIVICPNGNGNGNGNGYHLAPSQHDTDHFWNGNWDSDELSRTQTKPLGIYHYFDKKKCGAQLTLDFLGDLLGHDIECPPVVEYVNILDLALIDENSDVVGTYTREKTDDDGNIVLGEDGKPILVQEIITRYDALSSFMGRKFNMSSEKAALESLDVINKYTWDGIIKEVLEEGWVPKDRAKAEAMLKNPKFIWFQGNPKHKIPAGYIPYIEGDILHPETGRPLADAARKKAASYRDEKKFKEHKNCFLPVYIIRGSRQNEKGETIYQYSVRPSIDENDTVDASVIATQFGTRKIVIKGETITGDKGGGSANQAAFQGTPGRAEELYIPVTFEEAIKHPKGPPEKKVPKYTHHDHGWGYYLRRMQSNRAHGRHRASNGCKRPTSKFPVTTPSPQFGGGKG